MMDLSFRWPHPRYSTAVGTLSVRLHTFENVYGIDPERTTTTERPGGITVISAEGLTSAGGQRTTPGWLRIEIAAAGPGIRVEVTGEHTDGVRSIGVTLHDLRTADVTGLREGVLEVPSAGRLVTYPNGWFDLASPYFGVGDALTVRSLDSAALPKRFAFVPHFDNPELMDVDLLVEQDATRPSTRFTAPGWVIRPGGPASEALAEHRDHVRTAYPVDPWERRRDVPQWAREVSLVLTLHGQHYTGRTFLDYGAMLATVRQVAERIDGRRVLAYLPGWEGRYYRWYGRYDTAPDLGGDDGFRRLVEESRDLGVHVMPMFGSNIAARDLPGFERWGQPGLLRRASGLTDGGSVDWDASRHFDHGAGAIINPAYAPWRAHLVSQIADLWERFGFDATFLDITAMHANDPNGSTTEGLRSLVDELHSVMPDHLVAGEGWFDAIAGIVPLVQTGHRDTVPVHHDLPDEELFAATNRSFGHVCLGDPAHGSSGVHEAGYVAAWRLPVRRAVIPTLSVVEDTLTIAPHRVDEIIDDSIEYADRFLRSAASVR